MHNIEKMLSTIQEHYDLPTLTSVVLNNVPKDEGESLQHYLKRSDDRYPSMSGLVSKSLEEYFVTVFYCDSTDSDNIKTIDFGKLEGHTIPSMLEKANFFDSTKMWFVMLSHNEKLRFLSFSIYHGYLYCM